MKTRAKSPPRLKSFSLCEDIVRGLLRLPDGEPRVDRAAGVIRGVKVLGLESINRRRYLPEAVRRAAPLYEGATVYRNHPRKKERDEDRLAEDAFGWLESVRVEADGCLYGDLHVLNPATEFAESVFQAAERNPNIFGLSHNAQGDGEPEDGVLVVHSITEVRSVDLVAEPASTKGLFESRSSTMKVSIKAHLLEHCLSALKAGRKKRLQALCEALGDDAMMDAPAAGGNYRDSLYEAMKACESSGDSDMANKIHKLMAPGKQDVTEADEDPESDEEEEDDGVVPESRKGKGRGNLTEARAKTLCGLAGVKADADLLESLQAVPEGQALKLLEWAKKNAAPAAVARSRSLHATPAQTETEVKQLQESRERLWGAVEN